MAEEQQERQEQEVEFTSKPSLDDRYGGISSHIVELLKSYEYSYFREDKPIPFCGLLIYPATILQYEEFASCTACLTLNKNETVQGIRMSHLEYLLSKMQDKNNPEEARMWTWRLQRLLEIVFHIDNGIKCKKCGRVIKYSDRAYVDYTNKMSALFKKATEHPEEIKEEELTEDNTKFHCPECNSNELINMISIVEDEQTKKSALSVDGHIINKNDFDKLRQIVLFQNYPDYYDESNVDPEVKKDHDARLRIQQAQNDLHATIEQKITGLTAITHYSYEEASKLTIRRFTMTLSMAEDLLNYKIRKQAVMSGFVTLKKGETIEHWMYKPIKDIYGDSYKSTDQMEAEASNL